MRVLLFALPTFLFAVPCSGQSRTELNKQRVTLGSHKSTPAEGYILGAAGSQFALRVQNTKGAAMGTIRSVSFFIDNNGSPTQPFRVRLYRADGAANQPGSDLLGQSIVSSAAKGGGWFTVDLASHNITAPPEGFFVGMEWIADNKQPQLADTTETDFSKFQILRPTFEFKECGTWNYTIGKGWNLLNLANGQGRCYNAMIKAEVDINK